jgi:DNA invertase Pin-like site-specific DNA recombinase
MARTKNRQIKQAEKILQPDLPKIWKAGIYTRISVDINGEKRESLETQKLIALSYAEAHPDIEIVKFYQDDGISGTKFDRDDFVRMLNDIKSKEINTVIVKDLSRFGRDLEEVSNYLEKIFPFMQVRFISVNDNYDSISSECDNQMLGIMIANLANDMYAKDASVKSSGTMKLRMESGEYCGGDAPYGYKRAKDDKGNPITVPDPLTAPYAVQIFEKLAAGQSYLSISKEYNEKLLTPPRPYARTGKLFLDSIEETDTHWNSSTIKRIAENKHYLGNTYTHKTRTSLLTKERNTKLDSSEWNVHEDTHEALISEELFAKVQKIIEEKQKKAGPKKDLSQMKTHGKKENKYIGLIFCGECGAKMDRRYSRKERNGVLYYNYFYICKNYAVVSKTNYSCNRWTEEVIDELVYHAIIRQLKVISDLKNQLKRFNDEYYDTYKRYLSREQGKIIQLNKQNESRRLELYERYVSGEIDTEEYNCTIERVSVVEKELKKSLSEIEKSRKLTEKLCRKNYAWLSDFAKGKNTGMLTKEAVSSYVKKITLYEDKRIEIEFKFQDELMKLEEELEEGMIRCQMISA